MLLLQSDIAQISFSFFGEDVIDRVRLCIRSNIPEPDRRGLSVKFNESKQKTEFEEDQSRRIDRCFVLVQSMFLLDEWYRVERMDE